MSRFYASKVAGSSLPLRRQLALGNSGNEMLFAPRALHTGA